MQALVAAVVLGAVAAGCVSGPDPWRAVRDPSDAGWDADALERARAHAEEIGSSAVVVIDNGAVIAAWGDVDRPMPARSIRKALYGALFGIAASDGEIDVGVMLGGLGIDDVGGLSERERTATVMDLLAARSGVYHPAAYESASNAARRPERGSAAPGERWYYNNWDFNALPSIYERVTGRSVAEDVALRLAGPLGFEDFDPRLDVFEWLEPSTSEHAAVCFRVSARDLARLGACYLRGGDGIVPEAWIERSITAVTRFERGHYGGAGNGYGLLWWVYPGEPDAPRAWDRVDHPAALGAGGQALFLVPEHDVAIVHLCDTPRDEALSDGQVDALAAMIWDARRGSDHDEPALGPVRVEALGAPRGVVREPWQAPDARRRAALAGRYAVRGPGFALEIYEHGGRLFARPDAPGMVELELFVRPGDPGGPLFHPWERLIVEPVVGEDGVARALRLETPRGPLVADRSG
ncbi:MAG: serine hydrolase domain-containing protein [Phycisphaerales bacterium]